MPMPRSGVETSVVDGIIYAIGGTDVDWAGACLSTVEAYDPATDTWTERASMPTPRGTFSTSVVDGIIYAIGGTAEFADPPWQSTALPTVEAYDPVTDTWTEETSMPTARYQLATSVVDGIIYAIGGWHYPPEEGYAIVEAYDPATGTWTQKAYLPTDRYAVPTSVVDGRIYAIGVLRYGEPVEPTVLEYDPVTDRWAEKTPIPTARYGLSASVVDGIIYAIGGDAGYTEKSLPTVEAYTPSSEVNTSIEALGWGVIKALMQR